MPTRDVKKPGTKRKSPIAHAREGKGLHGKVDTKSNHEDCQLSRYGVYAYIRKADNTIMYIGKDSTIHESNRKSNHENPKNKYDQIVNTELQKNLNAYEYVVFAICMDKDAMEDTEIALIGALKAVSQCEWNVQNDLPQEILDD